MRRAKGSLERSWKNSAAEQRDEEDGKGTPARLEIILALQGGHRVLAKSRFDQLTCLARVSSGVARSGRAWPAGDDMQEI